jgi:hypothetical protein
MMPPIASTIRRAAVCLNVKAAGSAPHSGQRSGCCE